MEKIASIIGIDHVGYAVNDLNEAKERFEALGFSFSDDVIDELRDVNVSLGTNPEGFRVELLSPVEGRKSPIDGFLRKTGPTPYHICYKTSDIDESIAALKENGFTLMSTPAISVPLKGDVCFLYSSEIGIIELISYKGFE